MNGVVEDAVNARIIKDGEPTCIVGYVSLLFEPYFPQMDKQICRVTQDDRISPNSSMRRFSYENGGLAYCEMVTLNKFKPVPDQIYESDDSEEERASKKPKRIMVCGVCKTAGHNSRTCKQKNTT